MAVVDAWTHTVKTSRYSEAMSWLKRNLEVHISQGATGRILTPINGDTSKITTELEYESLQAMQDHVRDFLQSETWKSDLAKADWPEWFVEGGTVRHQYNLIR